MAERRLPAKNRVKTQRRSRKLRDDPSREQAQAEVIADLKKMAIKEYGSVAAWRSAAGVPPATFSIFLSNKGRPSRATVRALLTPFFPNDPLDPSGPEEKSPDFDAKEEERLARVFEQLVQGKLAERTKFRPILIPTCIAPFCIDSVTLRFGSHEANLSESDLTKVKATTPVFVHGLFLQRTPGSLPSNLERQSHRGVRHPTQFTPLTYLRYQRALAEQESIRTKDRHASLLVLDKWGMELGPRLFGIIRPTRTFHATDTSRFEASIEAGESIEQASDALRQALTKSRILYETTHAQGCLDDLIKKLGLHYTSCKLTKVGSIGAAYELAEQHLLDDCVLAIGHELLWSLAGKEKSSLELLVADEGHNEKQLLPDEPPFRVLAVRNDALSPDELHLTAHWFQKMSANLRDVWKKRFPQLCEFVKPEIEKYGSLGGQYSETHLRLLIAHGMHLHHPPLGEDPRFVPLDHYRPPARQLQAKPAAGSSNQAGAHASAAAQQPPAQEAAGETPNSSKDDRSHAEPNGPA